jgi:hypothetical protein
MFTLSVINPIRLSAISLKALATQTRVFPACLREVTVSLDFQLKHILESVKSKTLCLRLKAILKEVSDCCYKTSRAGRYSKSERL